MVYRADPDHAYDAEEELPDQVDGGMAGSPQVRSCSPSVYVALLLDVH